MNTALSSSPMVAMQQLQALIPTAELSRLLGYPRGVLPSPAVERLLESVRSWYARSGAPLLLTSPLEIRHCRPEQVYLSTGAALTSVALAQSLKSDPDASLWAVAASAGHEVDRKIAALWPTDPAGAYVLDRYAATVVETLMRMARRRAWSQRSFSPGCDGWDLSDQQILLQLVRQAAPSASLPLSALQSGMLEPRYSQLAVVVRSPRFRGQDSSSSVCSHCGLSSCTYRRSPSSRSLPPEEILDAS
jgi:hypothetical protein